MELTTCAKTFPYFSLLNLKCKNYYRCFRVCLTETLGQFQKSCKKCINSDLCFNLKKTPKK